MAMEKVKSLGSMFRMPNLKAVKLPSLKLKLPRLKMPIKLPGRFRRGGTKVAPAEPKKRATIAGAEREEDSESAYTEEESSSSGSPHESPRQKGAGVGLGQTSPRGGEMMISEASRMTKAAGAGMMGSSGGFTGGFTGLTNNIVVKRNQKNEEELEERRQDKLLMDQLWSNVETTFPKIAESQQRQKKEMAGIKSAIDPRFAFNLPLMRGQGLTLPGVYIPPIGRTHIPQVVSVIGREGMRNTRINGMYFRLPADRHGRPTYQKRLCVAMGDKKAPVHDDYGAEIAPEDLDPDRPTPRHIVQARDPKFLWFDNVNGRWYISSSVGGGRAFARCPVMEKVSPDRLVGWEVWDHKVKDWDLEPSVLVLKAGTVTQEESQEEYVPL